MTATSRETGLTTIEVVIVIALFGIVLVSLVGLHLVALSAGTAADGAAVAASLARARMEELLTLPPEGRAYAVRTIVEAPDPSRLDLTVTVTWHVVRAGTCAARAHAGCPGNEATYSRTLQMRVQVPIPP